MTRDDFFKERGALLSPRRIEINTWAFDGKTIATAKRSDSDIIHDLAHWDMATIKMRSVVNFGLGPSPDDQLTSPRIIPPRQAAKEESAASLLGIYYEWILRLDWRDTFLTHGWEYDGESHLWPFRRVYNNTWVELKDLAAVRRFKRLVTQRA